MKRFPTGVVRLVVPDNPSDWSQENVLPLDSLGDLYETLGASSWDFLEWQSRYGMASLGRNPEGQFLIPRFPIFSKVAWMHIDPVLLSTTEVDDLTQECERATTLAETMTTRESFQSICAIAERARRLGALIEFGHA